MSNIDGSSRPVRNRTVIPTYNLKVLTGNARQAPDGRLQKQISSRKQTMTCGHTTTSNRDTAHLPQASHSSTFSPLTSPIISPRMSAVNMNQKDVVSTSPDTRGQTYECFSKHGKSRGHYYSARQLYSHGVWIGYLAKDKQEKRYLECPSYSELKLNFIDMSLPYPPPSPSMSSYNRQAMCRGCFNEHSSLLTLHEIPFAKDRNVVIMPLDGDDEMGMFCILLPQPLDRSIKKLETWCPYELRNGGDGKIFDNRFMLLTLRYPNQDVGTIETVREALDLQALAQLAPQQGVHKVKTSIPVSDLALNIEEEELGEPLPYQQQARKRDQSEISNSPPDLYTKRRRRHIADCSTMQSPGALDDTGSIDEATDLESRIQYSPPASPNTLAQRPTLFPSNSFEEPPTLISRDIADLALPLRKASRTPNVTIVAVALGSSLTDDQARNIQVVWNFDMEGNKYELPLTLDECNTFGEMLELLRGMTQTLPSAVALLDITRLWRLTYTLPDGTKMNKMARTGTEVAFDRMRNELSQLSFSTGHAIEVELIAVS